MDIKVVSVAFNDGNMYVVDTNGVLWCKFMKTGEWVKVEMPEIKRRDVPRIKSVKEPSKRLRFQP